MLNVRTIWKMYACMIQDDYGVCHNMSWREEEESLDG
jgi:hypothetical protein